MRSLLFAPLGMSAGFGWPATADPEQPWGHGKRFIRRRPHAPHDAYTIPAVIAPAGDVNVSMADYGRFLQAHLRGLRGADDLLPAATIRFLHPAVAPDTANPHDALGWGIQEIDGIESHVHAGSAGTFYAIAALQPGRDCGVAVVASAGDAAAEASVKRAFRVVLAICAPK